jgi:hypothetical protein
MEINIYDIKEENLEKVVQKYSETAKSYKKLRIINSDLLGSMRVG